MTITLLLEPQEEANLRALARAKGLSAEALVREALKGLLAGASDIPNDAPSERATGTALVAAMQASPCKEIDLEALRGPLPARDIVF
jgi:hypothetical protein